MNSISISTVSHQCKINPFEGILFQKIDLSSARKLRKDEKNLVSSAGVPNTLILMFLMPNSSITALVAIAAAKELVAIRLCPQACPIFGRASYSN
jgi:hypothetical protein